MSHCQVNLVLTEVKLSDEVKRNPNLTFLVIEGGVTINNVYLSVR